MNKEIRQKLYLKYGHSKFLLCIHLFGRYIKNVYHHNKKIQPIIFGKNNKLSNIPSDCQIIIFGNNNRIFFDPSISAWRGKIIIGGDSDTIVDDCTVYVGKNSRSNGTSIFLCEHNSSVKIGHNCMFSWGIEFWASDTHSIYDVTTKKLVNWGKEIIVEDRCWIGMHCTILKNTHIANNSIVGAHSVVTKKFTESHCVIAGNPAKVVKTGISWDEARPNDYIKKNNVTSL